MNKTLIVLLATCLLTVHAFVKRDAPAATTENAISAQFEAMQKAAVDLLKGAQSELQENFEKVKKFAGDAVDKLKEVAANNNQEKNT